MTYMQKMGMDPTTVEGLARLIGGIDCRDIPDGRMSDIAGCPYGNKDCTECIAERLLAKVPTFKRWQTIKSDEDLMRFRKEFHLLCRSNACSECRLGYELDNSDDICFTRYLCEEVEK